MTAFHDAVLETAPVVFIPFDGPLDTDIQVRNLGSGGGHMYPSGGGTRLDRVGLTEFGKEIEFDGVNDYWVADPVLLAAIVAAANGASNFTAAMWNRTTYRLPASKTMFRLWQYGFDLRISSDNYIASYYNASGVQRSEGFPSIHEIGIGGGWQLGAMFLNDALYAGQTRLILGRNGVFQRSTGYVGDTLRTTSGGTLFTIGSDGTSTNFWLGSLGPLMIWNRALSADEFMALFQAGLGVAAHRSVSLRRPLGRRPRSDYVQLREPA